MAISVAQLKRDIKNIGVRPGDALMVHASLRSVGPVEDRAAGVVSAYQIKAPLNPNRWGKHLAPWFDDSCRRAKQHHRATCHTAGKNSGEALGAYRAYLGACKNAKWAFSKQLPDMLKYKPADFWKLLKTKNSSVSPVDLQKFAEFNEQLFCDPTAE